MSEPPYWKDYTYGKNKFKRNRVNMLEYQNERLNTRMYLNSIRSQTLFNFRPENTIAQIKT